MPGCARLAVRHIAPAHTLRRNARGRRFCSDSPAGIRVASMLAVTSRAPVPSSLHSLLGAIVAATLAGCVERHDDMMAVTQLGPETIESPILDGREGELLCIGYGASRVNGLAPELAYDSLAYYLESAAGEPELVELAGEPCASAPDRTSCLAEVERVRRAATGSGFPVPYARPACAGPRARQQRRASRRSTTSKSCWLCSVASTLPMRQRSP